MPPWPRPKEIVLQGITAMIALLCPTSLTVQSDTTVHQEQVFRCLALQVSSLIPQRTQNCGIVEIVPQAAFVQELGILQRPADVLQSITVPVVKAQQHHQNIYAHQVTSAKREQLNQWDAKMALSKMSKARVLARRVQMVITAMLPILRLWMLHFVLKVITVLLALGTIVTSPAQNVSIKERRVTCEKLDSHIVSFPQVSVLEWIDCYYEESFQKLYSQLSLRRTPGSGTECPYKSNVCLIENKGRKERQRPTLGAWCSLGIGERRILRLLRRILGITLVSLFFYSDVEPLSKYSPVTLNLSPATWIINENSVGVCSTEVFVQGLATVLELRMPNASWFLWETKSC